MPGLLTGQIEAGFEEANKRQALAPDVSRWLANPRNEGVADVGGEETVKISGAANDKQVLADIERLLTQVKSFKLADGLSPDERQEASKAIGALNVTVFTGATDRVLRRLVVTRSGRASRPHAHARGRGSGHRGAEGRSPVQRADEAPLSSRKLPQR